MLHVFVFLIELFIKFAHKNNKSNEKNKLDESVPLGVAAGVNNKKKQLLENFIPRSRDC